VECYPYNNQPFESLGRAWWRSDAPSLYQRTATGKVQSFRDSVHPVLELYDPFDTNKNMAANVKERRLVAQVNNGRLAMLGIFEFICANKIPDSVPLLDQLGAAQGYAGEPMTPFGGEFSRWSSSWLRWKATLFVQ
jgi:hypothetical protein